MSIRRDETKKKKIIQRQGGITFESHDFNILSYSYYWFSLGEPLTLYQLLTSYFVERLIGFLGTVGFTLTILGPITLGNFVELISFARLENEIRVIII